MKKNNWQLIWMGIHNENWTIFDKETIKCIFELDSGLTLIGKVSIYPLAVFLKALFFSALSIFVFTVQLISTIFAFVDLILRILANFIMQMLYKDPYTTNVGESIIKSFELKKYYKKEEFE